MAFKTPGKKHLAQIPRVKQSHKKSRKGCLVCKQRRVKCDEGRPSCRECSRRGTACAYAQTPNGAETGTSQSSISSPFATSPEDTETVKSTRADLFRHYLSHTITTFSTLGAHSEHFWQSVMPALAYTSEPIRLGILTISSLCLANDTRTDDPVTSRATLESAERYGWAFVEKSSEYMRTLDDERSEVSLACSRLLTVLAFAWFGVYRRHHGLGLEHEWSWTWLHLLRGTGTIHQRYEHAERSALDALANALNAREESASACGTSWSRREYQIIAESHETRFTALSEAADLRRPTLGDERSRDICSAIDTLRGITEDVCSKPKQSLVRCLCVWPCQVSKGFVSLLVQGNPLALVVHAHWLMLVALVRDVWFFGDMGCTCIRQIGATCESSEGDKLELALLDWPRRMVEACEELDGKEKLSHSQNAPRALEALMLPKIDL